MIHNQDEVTEKSIYCAINCKHPRPFCLFVQCFEETKNNQQVILSLRRVSICQCEVSIIKLIITVEISL